MMEREKLFDLSDSFVTVQGDNSTVYYVLGYTLNNLPREHGEVNWESMKMESNGLWLMTADGKFILCNPQRLEKTDKRFEPKEFKKGTEVKIINPKRDDYGKTYTVSCISYPFLYISEPDCLGNYCVSYNCIQII